MLVVTTPDIPGYRIDAVLGDVMGLAARSCGGFRSSGGGEAPDATAMGYASRGEVITRMTIEAHNRGANAIVGVRFDSGPLNNALSEVCAYGTAVIVVPIEAGEEGATTQSVEHSEGTVPLAMQQGPGTGRVQLPPSQAYPAQPQPPGPGYPGAAQQYPTGGYPGGQQPQQSPGYPGGQPYQGQPGYPSGGYPSPQQQGYGYQQG